jgi:hypothetical protein
MSPPTDKPAGFIDGRYVLMFAIRFFGMALVSFVILSGVILAALHRRLGVDYFHDISTLSDLQERLPDILAATGLIQAVAASFILLMMSLFWAHRISGPVWRFRIWLGMLRSGQKIEHIQFRSQDQLHGLAASFRLLQGSRERRRQRLLMDLKKAAGLIEECERSLKEGGAGSAESRANVKALREAYLAAKRGFSENHAS